MVGYMYNVVRTYCCSIPVMNLQPDITEKELRELLAVTESKCEYFETNMKKAAELGKGLLESNHKLEKESEKYKQEAYSLQIKVTQFESTFASEAEIHQNTIHEMEEDFKKSQKSFELKLYDLQCEISKAMQNDLLQQDKINEITLKYEKCQQNCDIMNARLLESSPKSPDQTSITDLECQVDKLKQEKVSMLEDICSLQKNVEALRKQLDDSLRARSEMEADLNDREIEISKQFRTLEEAQVEISELRLELEAGRNALLTEGMGLKGNSIFSEVEDRRHLVERELVSMRSRLEDRNSQINSIRKQLAKVRLHNISLLNMVASSDNQRDTCLSKNLQGLLEDERRTCKMLNDRLVFLLSTSSPSSNTEVTNKRNDNNFSGMMQISKRENEKLSAELKRQMWKNMEDRDKIHEYIRTCSQLESKVSQLTAENYRLKVERDERNTPKDSGSESLVKKDYEADTIFEDIRFEDDQSNSSDTKFYLEKEELAERPQKESSHSPFKDVIKEEIGARKKMVSLENVAEVIDTEGKVAKIPLIERINAPESDKTTLKLKSYVRPNRSNQLIDAEKDSEELENECATQ